MKKKDVKVGMRVVFDGEEGTVYSTECEHCEHGVWVDWSGVKAWIEARYLEVVQQPFPLANTKINVQKYAEENGISLEQAHKEIQPWLFEQGVEWLGSRDQNVRSVDVRFLYIYADLRMTNGSTVFNEHPNKEITLSRKATVELTPSFVEEAEPAVEYVELGGKRYVKSELEEALSKIKAVEE